MTNEIEVARFIFALLIGIGALHNEHWNKFATHPASEVLIFPVDVQKFDG